MTILLCFLEALMEIAITLGVVIIPFFVIGLIYKGLEFLCTGE